MLFKSFGKLNYNKIDNYFGVYLDTPQDIVNYYYNLIPIYKKKTRQKYKSHVTVVRIYSEIPTNLENWNLHQNKMLEFYYSNIIRENEKYYWLDVYSKSLEEVRYSLGLPVNYNNFDVKRSLFFNKTFHLTIGNKK